jgi:hypothetical protein
LQVPAGQRFHRRLQHLPGDASHLLQVIQNACVRGEFLGRLGDLGNIDGHVGNPLQVHVDVHQGGEQAQI